MTRAMAALVLLTLPGCATTGAFCGGAWTAYELVQARGAGPRPALLLLHGAGGGPGDVVEPWRQLAWKEDLVLIAPRLPRDEAFEAAAPAVFQCVLADAARRVSIDPKRRYLFGYSMGGYLALDGALLASDTFAAAAVFASGLAEPYRGLVDRASRKVPIALFVGTADPLVPLALVRQTRDLLVSRGFPVLELELPGADHRLGPVAAVVTGEAWKFMSVRRLEP